MSPRPDQIIAGKYRLIRRLARGGMGSVYRATHLDLETEVAIKFLHSDDSDGQAHARFKREARAAAQLKSPHVVQIFDYGVDENAPYIVMELLEGEDLGELLNREGTLEANEALEIITEAGRGLLEAHKAGVIHRDIKPANLFLAKSREGRVVKLLDFGIAKEAQATGAETTAGMVFGSPAYMSPEQARGGAIDTRSDLWSMGALLYKMLLGEPPFSGANPSDTVVKLCTEAPRPPSERWGRPTQRLDQFFEKALSKETEQRFLDVNSFLDGARDALVELPAGEKRPARVEPRGRSEETAPLEAPESSLSLTYEPSTTAAPENIKSAATNSRRRRLVWGLVSVGALVALGLLIQRKEDPPGPFVVSPPSRNHLGSGASAIKTPSPKVDHGLSPQNLVVGESSTPLGEPIRPPQKPPLEPRAPHTQPKKSAAPNLKKNTGGLPSNEKVPSAPVESKGQATPTDPVFGLPVGRQP